MVCFSAFCTITRVCVFVTVACLGLFCAQRLAKELGMPFLQTSARTAENVEAAFIRMAEELIRSKYGAWPCAVSLLFQTVGSALCPCDAGSVSSGVDILGGLLLCAFLCQIFVL